MRSIAVLLGVVLIFSAASVTSSQTTRSGDGQSSNALRTVRLVNTAEAYVHRSQGKYVPWPELISSGALEQTGAMNPDFSEAYSELNLEKGSELLHGFHFAMLVSSDGSAYKMSLGSNESCGIAYFSDERGIIYQGKALGCSA